MLLIYDFLLYLWRSATYELPYVGGRARGRQRPRAPSLKERPSGHRRRISLAAVPRARDNDNDGTKSTEAKRQSTGPMSRTTFEAVNEHG